MLILFSILFTQLTYTLYAEGNLTDEKELDNPFIQETGITEKLKDVMKESEETALIPVDIWISAIPANHIETQVKEILGYNRNDIINAYNRSSFENKPINIFSSDQIDLYIKTERNIYSAQQRYSSKRFIDECYDIYNLQKANISGDIFVSKYAPMIRVKLTKQ